MELIVYLITTLSVLSIILLLGLLPVFLDNADWYCYYALLLLTLAIGIINESPMLKTSKYRYLTLTTWLIFFITMVSQFVVEMVRTYAITCSDISYELIASIWPFTLACFMAYHRWWFSPSTTYLSSVDI